MIGFSKSTLPVLFCGWRIPNDEHKSLYKYLGFSQKKWPLCGPANGPLPQTINPQVSVFFCLFRSPTFLASLESTCVCLKMGCTMLYHAIPLPPNCTFYGENSKYSYKSINSRFGSALFSRKPKRNNWDAQPSALLRGSNRLPSMVANASLSCGLLMPLGPPLDILRGQSETIKFLQPNTERVNDHEPLAAKMCHLR